MNCLQMIEQEKEAHAVNNFSLSSGRPFLAFFMNLALLLFYTSLQITNFQFLWRHWFSISRRNYRFQTDFKFAFISFFLGVNQTFHAVIFYGRKPILFANLRKTLSLSVCSQAINMTFLEGINSVWNLVFIKLINCLITSNWLEGLRLYNHSFLPSGAAALFSCSFLKKFFFYCSRFILRTNHLITFN